MLNFSCRMVGVLEVMHDYWQHSMCGRDVTFGRATISRCTVLLDAFNGVDFVSFRISSSIGHWITLDLMVLDEG